MSNEPDWLDELYAEGADEQPPEELDARIRAAARRQTRHPWYSSPARLAGMATAASLVIAAGVLYFGPMEERLPAQAPAEGLMESEQAAPEPGAAAGSAAKSLVSGQRPIEPKRQAADRNAADRTGAEDVLLMPEPAPRAVSDTAESTAATPPAASGTPAKREQTAGQMGSAEQIPRFGRALQSLEINQAADLDIAVVARQLERLCGPLPGDETHRTITSDEAGWLVTVSIGADVRSWRCEDGAWIEEDSDQE